MDTGILGALILFACVFLFFWFLGKRYKAAEKMIVAEGFKRVEECPDFVSSLMKQIFNEKAGDTYRASNSSLWDDDTWIVRLKGDPSDEDSTPHCALVTKLIHSFNQKIILFTYYGRKPSSWLGKAALYLFDLSYNGLKEFYRLSDSQAHLISGNLGFVGYGQRQADITEILPVTLLNFFKNHPGTFLDGIVIDDKNLVVKASWTQVKRLFPYALRLRDRINTEIGLSNKPSEADRRN